VNLPGYRLTYGRKSVITTLKIFLQIPKILIQINREKRWLNIFLRREGIDAIISDNRYGLYSKKIISVFITHQLQIKTPFGKFIDNILQKLNYKYINQFSACWIPDFENNNALAGKLSHPEILPGIPVHYIGLLSRFAKKETSALYKILILLSGPEPQRTVLENIILNGLKSYSEKIILVRGLPGETRIINVPFNVEVHNHLSSMELNEKICQSEIVICRSGYSTVMDLARLRQKSIMIPTPGQTEQEYLAEYLFKNKLILKINQKNFSLAEAIEAAGKFPYKEFEEKKYNLLEKAISKLQDSMHGSKK
jgi:UDP-N-acetylglucosamine transferase subunit ALG13